MRLTFCTNPKLNRNSTIPGLERNYETDRNEWRAQKQSSSVQARFQLMQRALQTRTVLARPVASSYLAGAPQLTVSLNVRLFHYIVEHCQQQTTGLQKFVLATGHQVVPDSIHDGWWFTRFFNKITVSTMRAGFYFGLELNR